MTWLRAVRRLSVEVRIEVPVWEPTQGGALRLPTPDPHRADPEQRHVLENILTAEQAQLAAGEDRGPVLESDGQVHLAHVDLRAGLKAASRNVPELVVVGAVLNLRREPEVHSEG